MTGRYLTARTIDDLASCLTPRDLSILRSVSDLRFVSGNQLTRLHFSGANDIASRARAARRALLRLTRLDCLVRLPRVVGGVRAGSAGFVYHLGLAGQKLAMRFGWQPVRRGRRSRSPGTLFVGHSLQVAELHVRLVEADANGRLELLELSAEPACWRSSSGIGTQRQVTLKPDSFVRLGNGEFEDSWWIEVDRGTEGSRTVDRKLREYLAYQASGSEQVERGVFPKTVWLAPDERRRSVIEDCIASLPSASSELFAVGVFDQAIDLILEGSNAA